jgi:GH15 family glucan-1,4-alpha-glucosidase
LVPRELVLGNGNVLVNFDRFFILRELYFPYAGMDNHVGEGGCRMGVWVDGCFAWLDDPGWERAVGYRSGTMVGEVRARHAGLGIDLEIHAAVHYREDLYLQRTRLRNLREGSREVRLFWYHHLDLAGQRLGDTAFFEPETRSLCHHKGWLYFLISGRLGEHGISCYTIGKRASGRVRYDPLDGALEGCAVDHGVVESAAGFAGTVAPYGEAVHYYWLAAGRSWREVAALHGSVVARGAQALLEETTAYWEHWLGRRRHFSDLPPEVVALYRTSLLAVRTHCDNRGGILAATDHDIMLTNRDNYNYVWPRDGALVAHALDLAGYPELSRRYYAFCARVLDPGGFFWPKYRADGAVGSSWHPRVDRAGRPQLAIQEDETGCVLWALGRHVGLYRNLEWLAEIYPRLVLPAADFLQRYRDPATGLPRESYDLWEERRGVSVFTAAAVYGGLVGAATCAALLGDGSRAAAWRRGAAEVRTALVRHLYHPQLGRFLRRIHPENGDPAGDFTLDGSFWGLAGFGVLSPDDPRLARTMLAVAEGLRVRTEVGGIARYTGDYYFRQTDDLALVPGNPWFVTTLWLADWYAAGASHPGQLRAARELLLWAAVRRQPGGLLPEQLHPFTGEALSVSPLTWSHATLVLAVERYVAKYRELHGREGEQAEGGEL